MSLFVDIVISIVCIIVTLGISQFLREFAKEKWSKDFIGRQLFMELVATFELTAVAYENSIVFHNGGKLAFSLFLLWVWYWRTEHWQGVSATPCSYLVDFVTRRISFMFFVLVCLAQLIGGFIAYSYYTPLYWKLGLVDAHTAMIHGGFQSCTSHIQDTPLSAAMMEGGGLFLYITLANLIRRSESLEGAAAGLLESFIGTGLVIYALTISGGYYNPILASSVQFGCKGSTVFEHIQVYWIGNMIGALLAHYADSLIFYPITKTVKSE